MALLFVFLPSVTTRRLASQVRNGCWLASRRSQLEASGCELLLASQHPSLTCEAKRLVVTLDRNTKRSAKTEVHGG